MSNPNWIDLKLKYRCSLCMKKEGTWIRIFKSWFAGDMTLYLCDDCTKNFRKFGYFTAKKMVR